jgi:hypothetical protein
MAHGIIINAVRRLTANVPHTEKEDFPVVKQHIAFTPHNNHFFMGNHYVHHQKEGFLFCVWGDTISL